MCVFSNATCSRLIFQCAFFFQTSACRLLTWMILSRIPWRAELFKLGGRSRKHFGGGTMWWCENRIHVNARRLWRWLSSAGDGLRFFFTQLLPKSSHQSEDNQETRFDCYLSSFLLCSLLSATRTLISGSRILFPIHFFLEGRIMDAEQVKRFEWFSLNRRCRFISARWLSWLNVSHKKTPSPAFCQITITSMKSVEWLANYL